MSAKVLVVDDSMMIRTQVSRALVAAGFSVVEACDGRDALLKLAGNDDVSLVVCDINMPNMNGIDFLDTVRTMAIHAALPVVMLTTEGTARSGSARESARSERLDHEAVQARPPHRRGEEADGRRMMGRGDEGSDHR